MEKRYHYITLEDYETAEKNGIPAKLVELRAWRYKWDIDKAITKTPKAINRYDDLWDEWSDIAAKHGVDRNLFVNRVSTLKWDEESAATIARGKNLVNKWTDEEIAIAEKNGIAGQSMSLVSVRINQLGWSRENALTTPRLTDAQRVEKSREGTRKYYRERGGNSGFIKTV